MQGIPASLPPGRYVLLYSGGLDSSYILSTLSRQPGVNVVLLHAYMGRRLLDIAVRNARRVYPHQLILYLSNHRELLMVAVKRLRRLRAVEYTCLACKALMMREASLLAERVGARGIITGETLGQVASQTLPNMMLIHSYASKPVYTPLLALDKHEAGNRLAHVLEKTPSCPFLPKRRITRPDPILAEMIINEAVRGLDELVVFERLVV